MKKRKTNKAKRSVSCCKNNGDCCFCKGNRTYQTRKEEQKSTYEEFIEDEEQKELLDIEYQELLKELQEVSDKTKQYSDILL